MTPWSARGARWIVWLWTAGGLAACSAPVAPSHAQAAPPRLELSATEVDFGRLDPYERHERTVHLRNTGGSTLLLAAVQSTCACTRAALEQYSIPPGGAIPLSIDLHLEEYNSDSVRTRVHVQPADPQLAAQAIDVTAEVAPEFVLEPAELDWGRARQGSAATKVLTLRRTGKPALHLEKVEVPPPWTSSTTEVTPDECRVEVTLPAEAPRGALTGHLAVVTDVKRRPRREVALRAEVVGLEYTVTPRVLVFGPVPPGTEAGTFELTSAEPLKVVEVQSPPPSFEWRAEEAEEGRRVRLRLSVAKDAKAGDLAGKLRVVVRAGTLEETLELPYFGTVGPPGEK